MIFHTIHCFAFQISILSTNVQNWVERPELLLVFFLKFLTYHKNFIVSGEQPFFGLMLGTCFFLFSAKLSLFFRKTFLERPKLQMVGVATVFMPTQAQALEVFFHKFQKIFRHELLPKEILFLFMKHFISGPQQQEVHMLTIFSSLCFSGQLE